MEIAITRIQISTRDLREAVVGEEKKVLCAMIHSAKAVELVKNKVKQIRLEIWQKEYDGESHNVIAELPGKREEWIVLSAHYDTTSLSHGAYDNMSGCAGLLGIMEQMKEKERNYGLRFVFCGSEERGLLGSKAYVRDHEKELRQIVLNINLDMIGTYMGKFIACVSAEEKLTHYISYMAAEVGFPIAAENGVYSSDSTPFADHGVPAVSFARIASGNVAPIHCRYDVKDVMSMEQLQKILISWQHLPEDLQTQRSARWQEKYRKRFGNNWMNICFAREKKPDILQSRI